MHSLTNGQIKERIYYPIIIIIIMSLLLYKCGASANTKLFTPRKLALFLSLVKLEVGYPFKHFRHISSAPKKNLVKDLYVTLDDKLCFRHIFVKCFPV